jgi:hypothetical protein
MRTFLIKRGGLGLLVIGILLVSVSITYAGAGLLADIIGQSDKTIKLEPLASGLTAPNFGTSAPGDESRLFVSDQDGILWAIDLDSGDKSVFADLSSLLVPLGAFGPGSFTPLTACSTPSPQNQ